MRYGLILFFLLLEFFTCLCLVDFLFGLIEKHARLRMFLLRLLVYYACVLAVVSFIIDVFNLIKGV